MGNSKTMLLNIELYFPELYERMTEYKFDNFHPYEAVLTLTDGRMFLYDDICKTARKLPANKQEMTRAETFLEFGKRLQRVMLQRGMTQAALSEKTGISQPAISTYVRGTANPSFYTVDKIAKALDCSVDEFRYI